MSLESVFPVKHKHVGDSFDNDQLCEGLNANEVEPLCHTDIFPNNSLFFSKSISFYRWGAIYLGSSDHVDLQAKQKFPSSAVLLPLMKIVRFDFISP